MRRCLATAGDLVDVGGSGKLSVFFDALDACLEEPVTVVLVGASLVILAYGATTTTVDIDTLRN